MSRNRKVMRNCFFFFEYLKYAIKYGNKIYLWNKMRQI